MQSLASRILERTGGPNNGRGIKISTVKLLAQSLVETTSPQQMPSTS